MAHARMVLVDLVQNPAASTDAALTSRLPCSIAADDLIRLRDYIEGNCLSCDVVLAFRYQDLDDLDAPHINEADEIAGFYETSGATLLDIPDSLRLSVSETYESGGGVSLARPGRHLLCASCHGHRREKAVAASVRPAIGVGRAHLEHRTG